MYFCSTYVRAPIQTAFHISPLAPEYYSPVPLHTHKCALKYSTSYTDDFHVFTIVLRKDSHRLSIEMYTTLLII